MFEKLVELDQRMNYGGIHAGRWTLAAALAGALGVWVFRENVSAGVGDAASEVTRRTLEDQGVQLQASELARGVVYELLNDAKALELATAFVGRVLARGETNDALRALVLSVLAHPEVVNGATELVMVLLTDERLKQSTSAFFRSVMETPTFVAGTDRLASDTVYSLMEDEGVKRAAVTWVNAVLADPALQSRAGDAAWGAVRAALGFKPAPTSSSPTTSTSPHELVAAGVGSEGLKNQL